MPVNLPVNQTEGPTHERRSFVLRELRVVDAEGGGKTPLIEGYAAVFGVLSEDLGGFREMVRPGTYKRTITAADVRALINHDPSLILGRTLPKTLELAEDIHGLRVKITPPDTSYANDLLVSVRRGDIDQMSFQFTVPEGGDEWRIVGDEITRTLMDVDLYDVALVTFPAYPQTSVHVRSKASALQSELQQAHVAAGQVAHPAAGQDEHQAVLEILSRRVRIAERE
jgi:HK97 family phage prohead protease